MNNILVNNLSTVIYHCFGEVYDTANKSTVMCWLMWMVCNYQQVMSVLDTEIFIDTFGFSHFV